MFKRLLIGALLITLASSTYPLLADYSDLEATSAVVVDDQIVIRVDNPNTTAESARIQVVVKIEDGTTEVLTIPTVTLGASSTVFVVAQASATIVGISDDPQPISP